MYSEINMFSIRFNAMNCSNKNVLTFCAVFNYFKCFFDWDAVDVYVIKNVHPSDL